MHDYFAVRFNIDQVSETITDLLAAFLADEGFETFEPDESGLTAYIRKESYKNDSLKDIIDNFPIPCNIDYRVTLIEGEDWNKEWEQNYFKPILIDDRLLVRSSFHTDYPPAPIEIIIDPKMAFGTGHHSTTAGMCKMILDIPMEGKNVIDMGTGTGILAMLSKKLGASKVTGIDIDEFAIDNAKENAVLNSVDVKWETGDDKVLEKLEPADIFLANINLNVIKDNLEKYLSKLKNGGSILLSGFLVSDRDQILKKAADLGLEFEKETSNEGWLTMKFKK